MKIGRKRKGNLGYIGEMNIDEGKIYTFLMQHEMTETGKNQDYIQ